MVKTIVLDTETNGLFPNVSKIHVICYAVCNDYDIIASGYISSEEEFMSLMKEYPDYYICAHNMVRYERKLYIKLLGFEIPIERCFDTLALSYYLYPYKESHGLAAWGKSFGIPKPEVEDWSDQPSEVYYNRCYEDVKINLSLYFHFISYLLELYGSEDLLRDFINYLSFKMDCLADQEDYDLGGISINLKLAKTHLDNLTPIYENKKSILQSIMPIENAKLIKSRPKVMFKADGSVSANGIRWFQYLEEKGLPGDTMEVRDLPNPNSDVQIKTWLFSLGWQPQTFKDSKTEKGKKIPQINLPFGQGICPSVKALYEVEPQLIELEGYYQVLHRMGIFKAFLEMATDDGRVFATAAGFTNTHRLTHAKPCVNLPKPGVFYGQEVREVMVVDSDDYIMIGADISGLEDNTKQHYIYTYDPSYVEEMQQPGFDPHLDIGKLAKLITPEEALFYLEVDAMSSEEKKNLSEEDKLKFKKIKDARGISKQTNFSATYGAGGPKISEAARLPLEDGYMLHGIYWKRNWAVKEVADNCYVKVVRNKKWLYNPTSGFWLFLKNDKDKFSLLNQNTGCYVFDLWVLFVRKKLSPLGINVLFQYHDELMLICLKEYKDTVKEILQESMDKVNEYLRLNVTIKISIGEGNNYAEVH